MIFKHQVQKTIVLVPWFRQISGVDKKIQNHIETQIRNHFDSYWNHSKSGMYWWSQSLGHVRNHIPLVDIPEKTLLFRRNVKFPKKTLIFKKDGTFEKWGPISKILISMIIVMIIVTIILIINHITSNKNHIESHENYIKLHEIHDNHNQIIWKSYEII